MFDESRLFVAHYKKSDWQDWGDPILNSIMDDIILLKKMKLTDLAALDGAMSHIRIWKLGSLDHRIAPTEAAFKKLNDVLLQAGNGQSLDLMWGPDLTLEETKSDIHKYLGQEKYIPVLSAIYSGLGIPPSLIGGAGERTSNNSLQMKMIVERLNYGRQELTRFWENEIKIVQQAMQFRFPAEIEYKNAILTDEASYNSLLIDLLDREVISLDRIRDHLGYVPGIEESLVKKEWKGRDSKKIPPKAGPFHNPEREHELKKLFIPTRQITPNQVGLDLPDPKPSEKKILNNLVSPKENNSKPSPEPDRIGQQGQGRPKNSKDKVPRKRASGEMDLFFWAKDAQQKISDIMNPICLKMCNRKNMRSLTMVEAQEIERLKFSVLCNIEPYSNLTAEFIREITKNALLAHPEADEMLNELTSDYINMNSCEPSVEDVKQMQSYVYSWYRK